MTSAFYIRLKTDQGTFYWNPYHGGYTDRKEVRLKRCRYVSRTLAEQDAEKCRRRYPSSLLKPDIKVVPAREIRE